ncbi:carboxyltransferase domain-containing protein [Neobacillus sp. WH10]|uniref:carboxyltransferase domain-containing protein n=1 Tax=Neobacillus sp. WH10 TaxID=3047873 RepID=UPI0032E04AEA
MSKITGYTLSHSTTLIDIIFNQFYCIPVGIAGQQTGVYSLTTPGGWRIIGHTPTPLFRPNLPDQPALISAGDAIRFVPVIEQQYYRISTSW